MLKIFKTLLLALIPATLVAVYSYREKAILLILVGVVSAVASEALFQWVFKRKYTYKDGGAVVTGLLLALSVSPSTPLVLLAGAAAVAIILGKQVYGGFPKNIFNPALLGRLFIVYLFPTAMQPWLSPVDMVSTSTPLRVLRETGEASTSILNLFLGNVGGSIGEISALAILLGAAYLIHKKFANYRIPVGILSAVAVVAVLTGQNPFFHLFSGSLMFASFFMATDPATAPKSDKGKWIYGVSIGLMVMSIRLWGWVPEGTTFAILGMNYLVPFINTELDRLKAAKVKKEA
ncbi:MAG: RnfABCDGE type electron transport complex subunit D [Erysipelothrix sp.]|nr:RnfABCDGE type electron transport complex subunit D [Erysipelothrix sp.]